MSATISGGCACGEIRYECSGEPSSQFNCHCEDCQRATGGAFFPGLKFASESFRFTKGTPSYHEMKSDSGSLKRYGFCRECGSPIDATIESLSGVWFITAGSLDDPDKFTPTTNYFVSSARPWVHIDPGLKNLEKETE